MKLFSRMNLSVSKPKTKESRNIAYMYAFLLIVFALCQLFTFEKFVPLLQDFMLPLGDFITKPLAALIVISEVFALPYLLNMPLSPLMRISSMIFGWIVPLTWLKLSLWLTLSVNAVTNMGLFGTVIKLVPGWWSIFFAISLGLLAAWASWGMWPIESKKQKIS